MYTLRLFKDVEKVDRQQIYLGDSYIVRDAEKEDKELGIKLRVFGNWDSHTKEGLCVREDDHAFIMTQLGGTFETLNRPMKSESSEHLAIAGEITCDCSKYTSMNHKGRFICSNCEKELEIK
jgi:hypothetical protein